MKRAGPTMLQLGARSELDHHGQQSVLAPGTQFKVKSKSKKGNVAEITLEEVGRAIA